MIELLAYVLAALFVFDGLRLRARWASVFRLEPGATLPSAPLAVVMTPDDGALPAGTIASASAFLEAEGLDALDLLPGRWRAADALAFVQLTDPAKTFGERLSPARTAGLAVAMREGVAERAKGADLGPEALRDLPEVAFRRRVAEVRRCAPRMAHAVAPELEGRALSVSAKAALFRELVSPAVGPALFVPILVYAFLGLALAVETTAGLVALGAFCAQPLFVLVGAPVGCADLPLYALLRLPLDLVGWAGLAFGGGKLRAARESVVQARRPTYEALVARGLEPFFEVPATACPLCGGSSLEPALSMPDRIQHKPGRFTIARCKGCDHLFQNPRLSLEGLAYYYRDFYDGLGESGTEAVFGFSNEPYLARARMLRGHDEPTAWLDVGAGHGHFCLAAREVWPKARFDGLDLSDGVDLAVRRGWMDAGIRGLFPERARDVAGRYDVVSMSHYLEHTREPRAELAAASIALREGGHLLVEIPDPTSALRRLFGTYWMPWFQPQHQHFLDSTRLRRLLDEAGFDVVDEDRGSPHHPVDFALAVLLFLDGLAPAALPWRPPPSTGARVMRRVIWFFGWPWLFAGMAADKLLRAFLARPGWSNAFRVLAKKRGP